MVKLFELHDKTGGGNFSETKKFSTKIEGDPESMMD
jgi:hypothetical protein